jgi:hypothetical protein
MNNETGVGKVITPSVPIPTSPAIVIGLERGREDGNVIPLKGGRWRKRYLRENEGARLGGIGSFRK